MDDLHIRLRSEDMQRFDRLMAGNGKSKTELFRSLLQAEDERSTPLMEYLTAYPGLHLGYAVGETSECGEAIDQFVVVVLDALYPDWINDREVALCEHEDENDPYLLAEFSEKVREIINVVNDLARRIDKRPWESHNG